MNKNHTRSLSPAAAQLHKIMCAEIVKRRKLNGISQKQLADSLKADDPSITAARLCKLEQGWHLPNEKILRMIEERLAMPSGFLVDMRNQIRLIDQNDGEPIFTDLDERLVPACDQHALSDEGLKTLRRKIIGELDTYDERERYFGIPSFCRLTLHTMDASTAIDGIAMAEALREELGNRTASLAALIPELELKNFRFIAVDNLPPSKHSDGKPKIRPAFVFHDRQLDNPVICVNQQATPYSQLYDIAYSIGSYLRHRHFVHFKTTCSSREHTFCRAFASSLLMPEDALRLLIDELNIKNDDWTHALLDRIALHYGVSCMALLHRLKDLRRIDETLIDSLKIGIINGNPGIIKFAARPNLQFGNWFKILEISRSS